jgi:hypothetical protein
MTSKFSTLLLQMLCDDSSRLDEGELSKFTPDDWELFKTEVLLHGLAYQVKKTVLSDSKIHSFVPKDVMDSLDNEIRSNCIVNLVQQSCLNQMLSACLAADIPVMVLKGLWLTELVHRDLGAKCSGDIDLLFHHCDLPRLLRMTQNMGFYVSESKLKLCDFAASDNEFQLLHPTQKVVFDIHWAVTHPVVEEPIDEEKLWRRSEMVKIAGVMCRSLCVEDHLLYLCFHAVYHHRFTQVGPRVLLDISCLIAKPPRPIDWDELVARARELGWDRGTWLMLDLIQEQLGTWVPQFVLDALKPEAERETSIHAAALETLFLGINRKKNLPPTAKKILETPSWFLRAKLIFKKVFPSRSILAAWCGIADHNLCTYRFYPIYWRYLINVHLFKFIGLIRGDKNRIEELARMRIIYHWLDKQEAQPVSTERLQ